MKIAWEYLHSALAARLVLRNASETTYTASFHLNNAVLETPRLILITKGCLDYYLDDQQWVLHEGEMVLVPAYLLRWWREKDNKAVRLLYFEYTIQPSVPELPTLFWTKPQSLKTEIASMRRIIALYPAQSEERVMEAEGEMKASLARFLTRAQATTQVDAAHHPHHADLAVAKAVRWMASHFTAPDCVARTIEQSRLSPNHFRLVFKQRLSMNPQQYLLRIRMHHARFLLHERSVSVKEVANQVGYNSVYHFSRMYRKFWNHPPSEDRPGTS